MKEIIVKFNFSDELGTDEKFIKEFQNNIDWQIYYFTLKDHFGESNFFLSDKRLLDKGFIKAISAKSNYKWCEKFKYAFDSAAEPFFSGCLLDDKDISTLQSVLYNIYKKFGRKGINDARNLYIAQGLFDAFTSTIVVQDDEDIYDLEVDYMEHEEGKIVKTLELTNSEYNPEKRAMDALSTKVLVNYPNENVKSALFKFPQLLYKETGELIEEEEILALEEQIESMLPESGQLELNEKMYWASIDACEEIYLEKNSDKLPRKESAQQYQKKKN